MFGGRPGPICLKGMKKKTEPERHGPRHLRPATQPVKPYSPPSLRRRLTHGRRRPPPTGLLPGRRLRALLPPLLAPPSPARRYTPRLLSLPVVSCAAAGSCLPRPRAAVWWTVVRVCLASVGG
jgi:hypothetical protein